MSAPHAPILHHESSHPHSGNLSSLPKLAPVIPDCEVREKASRRKFTSEYKRSVLQQADACSHPGEIGALLRREGLYSSHLKQWRSQRARAIEQGLAPRKRGRPLSHNPLAEEVGRLERENRRLRQQLEQARLLIDIQKKTSQLLGIQLTDVTQIEQRMNREESDS